MICTVCLYLVSLIQRVTIVGLNKDSHLGISNILLRWSHKLHVQKKWDQIPLWDWNNLKLNKYIWELSNLPKNLTDQTISSCKCRVYCGSHSNQATRHSKLQFIFLRKQRYNPRKDRCALDPTTLILGCNSRSHFNLLPNSQHSLNTFHILSCGHQLENNRLFQAGRHCSSTIVQEEKIPSKYCHLQHLPWFLPLQHQAYSHQMSE